MGGEDDIKQDKYRNMLRDGTKRVMGPLIGMASHAYDAIDNAVWMDENAEFGPVVCSLLSQTDPRTLTVYF
jgi:hypothetical protein